MLRRQFATHAALATLAFTATLPAIAQSADPTKWPAGTVTMIVPSSPGGGTDVYGRILAQALTEQFKQSFVVENRPGASGAIGATAVAKAEPNGYTMLVASNSSLGINPVLYEKLAYDVEKDFAPVTRGVIAPMVIAVNPEAKLKSMKDLVERGKSAPGTLFYGSAGVGSPLYIGVRMIEDAGGAQFNHVPYKGAGPAYQDLLGGRLQFMLADLASVRPYIDSGKLQALSITDKSKLLPSVPTFAEAGFPNIKAFTSFSVMLPAKTPPALIKRIADEIQKAMKNPATVQRLEQQALIPVYDTPEQFAKSLKAEHADWGNFIKAKNIKPD